VQYLHTRAGKTNDTVPRK